ncbi:MAG: helix-turn-helix domain-containing protein [Planctomycetes bacterium]|nr:helix-turn-helix domain-containing protein [Planctomycetota bacterium]
MTPADPALAVKRLAEPPALLDVEDVARLLTCSTRHVRRLADSGRMPRPLKIGALVRWRRGEIDAWIAAGCPARLEVKKSLRKPVDR